MTWEERLFSMLDDLEQQAEAMYDAERDVELADRRRAEYAQISLTSRLMASVGCEVGLEVEGVGLVQGRLQRAADDWCLVAATGQDWVVRVAAVTLVRGASDRSVPEVAWSPVARLGLGSALRRIADTREPCVLHRVDGRRHEAVLTRVGQDFVEACGPDDTLLLFPYASLAAVQSRP